MTSTIARQPLLAVPLVLGLLVGFGALILRLQGVAFGPPSPPGPGGRSPTLLGMLPIWAHLALVLGAGLYLPVPLVAWFQSVARLLG